MSDRLAGIRRLLRDLGLDGALITSYPNRYYLTGYTAEGNNGYAGVALIDQDNVVVASHANNVDWARDTVFPGVQVELLERPWPQWITNRMGEAGWRRVGFEDADLTVRSFNALRALPGSPELAPLGSGLDTLRQVKDDTELALLARAIQITDETFTLASAQIREGMTERELAWIIDRTFRELGADGSSFATSVCSGPHAARPHHDPTDRPFAPGEPIIIDMGARYRGYCADLTRTVWVGEPSPELRTIYNIVFASLIAALDQLRAGMSSAESDGTGRAVIDAAGYADKLPHGLGHGVGIEIHEAPFMGKQHSYTLDANAVVTVEPGIYLPGWGGVRLEDVVVIESAGNRRLSQAPMPGPI